ncbi:MAG: hypothetical protein KAV82_00120 [Phycisphaerae bacterium]|nr:hypothetical protein [Phycisphaerae bacterium]
MRPVRAERGWRVVCALVMAGGLAAASLACTVYILPTSGGEAAEDSAGEPPGLVTVLTTDRYQMPGSGAAVEPVTIHVVVMGGRLPYTYQWSATDPAGQPADELLDTSDSAVVHFSAGPIDGPYEITCTVTDAARESATCCLVVLVGTSLGLDLSTERLGVVAGGGEFGQTTVQLNPQGGVAPYDVTWTVIGPDGNVDNTLLDLADPLAPVFVSGSQVGIYVLTATVVDAEGAESVESIIVVVGQHLGLDVTASRASVLPGGGADGMARLLATPIGGQEPYTYDWEVIGPDDQQYDHLLWDTTVRSPVFESDDLAGFFVARCAVTDGVGTVMIGSTTIVVGQQIGISVTAGRLALWTAGGSGGQTVLSTDVRGGREPIAIDWRVTGPDGQQADDNLSATDEAEVTFTAPTAVGPYVIRCSATDADGVSATDAVTLTVGGTLGVVVTADRLSLAPGGSAQYGSVQLFSHVYGGTAPYSFKWTTTDPEGGSAPNRLDSAGVAEPIFTSSSTVGSYAVLCTVTDAAGAVAADAVVIDVGLPLNVDVTVDRQSLVGGGGVAGQAQLITTIHGGVAPYSYEWSVVAPNGQAEATRLSGTTVAQPVFTSGFVLGTYRLTLTVTDAEGSMFTDSVEVVVGGSGPGAAGEVLSLDVSADDQVIASGGGVQGTADLRAVAIGGVAPLSYLWSVTTPTGTQDDGRLASTTGPMVTFTSTTTQGTYRVSCTVTDAIGNVFADSAQIEVTDQFLTDLTASSTTVDPGEVITLMLDRTGGVPSFTYDWSCLDSTGAPVAGFTTDPQTGVGDVTNTWTAPAALGTYRITCVATDAEGNTFTDSVMVTVSNAFFLDVTATATYLSPNETVTLAANRTGGSPDFTYDWNCLDSAGAPVAGFATDPQSASGDVTNTWTAPATLGAYRIVCVASDADGHTFTDSVTVTVTDTFLLDVTASDAQVSPGAVVTLTANRTGGSPDFTYDWSCLDSTGGSCAGFAADPQTAADDVTNTWTAPAALGTCRITCLATDADGHTFTDSAKVTVTDAFLLDLTADVTHLAPGGVASLVADKTGGSANFQYVWTARDSTDTLVGTFAGGVANSGTLTQTGQPGDGSVTWTAPAGLGTYRITCTATDADGHTFIDSVMVTVNDTFYLDVVASDTYVKPNATTSFTVRRVGGAANLAYEWSCYDESDTLSGTFTTGSLGPDSGRATQSDNGAQVTNGWQAPAAGPGTLGTYRIVVVGSDANGLTFTDSLEVVVDAPLSLDVTADRTRIAALASTDLLANRTGGEPNFTYVWSAQDSSGTSAGAFTSGSTGPGAATQAGLADDATNTWTAPAAVSDTYTIICVTTDWLGSTFTDSVNVVVGSVDALSLDLTAHKVFVGPGDTVNLSGNQTAGGGPFDYTWSATNESGAAAGTLGAATQNGVAGDTTNTWNAPAAAAGVLGTYRIEAEISDAAGDTCHDSVHVVVQSPLSLNVTANDTFVGSSTSITLTANQTGGETTYDYTWTATDSSGALAGTFATGSTGVGQATQGGVAGDTTNTWSAIATDTYTITCTVADNCGEVFADSVAVVVTNLEMFSLDVTTDKSVVWPGEVVNLVGDRVGGTATFNYAWSALNEAGAAAGTLGAANQNGVADDTTNTWTAPNVAGDEGTYRIRCMVTDAAGNSFTDTVFVEVSTLALQNVFLAPAAADTSSVLGLTNFTASSVGADPGQQVLEASLTNPIHPRNVIISITDGNTSITGGTARVTGLNARGRTTTEIISIAATSVTTTNTGLVPFAAVTQVDLYSFTGVTTFPPIQVDKFEIGVGTRFGLTGVLDAASDVGYINEGGTVLTTGYTVDTTTGQQGITFANAPDGARNYIVVFRAR